MPSGVLTEIRSAGAAGAEGSGATVARLAALPGIDTASGVAAATHAQASGRILPVLPALSGLFPGGGLRRGSTVAVHGSTSLLLALLAEATAGGSWAAVVGLPGLGVVAADELGIAVHRLALVPRPGADFAAVTAALIDGLDLVVADSSGGSVRAPTARRLSARARHRGAVLLSLGPWPGAEIDLSCTPTGWSGPEDGYGHLRERQTVVAASGRGAAARPLRSAVLLPGPGGSVVPALTGLSRGAPDEVRVG